MPANGTQSPSLAALAEAFNLAPDSGPGGLLEANRTLRGFLNPGMTWQPPGGGTAISVSSSDTVESLLRRANESGGKFRAADLAAANHAQLGLLSVGQPFLLVPTVTKLSTAMTPSIPGGTASMILPIQVWLDLARGTALVHPDFAGVTGVFTNMSPVGPQTQAGDGPQGLAGFAEASRRRSR